MDIKKKKINDKEFNTFINKFTDIDVNNKILKQCVIIIQKNYKFKKFKI